MLFFFFFFSENCVGAKRVHRHRPLVTVKPKVYSLAIITLVPKLKIVCRALQLLGERSKGRKTPPQNTASEFSNSVIREHSCLITVTILLSD